MWVIDEETAAIVRRIFKMCIEGYGPTQIAKALTRDGIPTPTAYQNAKDHIEVKQERWASRSVSYILGRAFQGSFSKLRERTEAAQSVGFGAVQMC